MFNITVSERGIIMDGSATKQSYLLGFIGALLGAFVGAIPWAIAYYFGWFVGWLGFLIGVCAVKGYEFLCQRTGKMMIFIIIVSVIFGVIAGQVLGDFIEIASWITKGEIYATYFDIPAIYLFVLRSDSSIIPSMLGSLAMGFVFAGLGVWQIIRNMVSDLGNTVQEETDVFLMD